MIYRKNVLFVTKDLGEEIHGLGGGDGAVPKLPGHTDVQYPPDPLPQYFPTDSGAPHVH